MSDVRTNPAPANVRDLEIFRLTKAGTDKHPLALEPGFYFYTRNSGEYAARHGSERELQGPFESASDAQDW